MLLFMVPSGVPKGDFEHQEIHFRQLYDNVERYITSMATCGGGGHLVIILVYIKCCCSLIYAYSSCVDEGHMHSLPQMDIYCKHLNVNSWQFVSNWLAMSPLCVHCAVYIVYLVNVY